MTPVEKLDLIAASLAAIAMLGYCFSHMLTSIG
jgi:hypothetical protein